MPTTEARFPFTLTFAGSDTQSTNWVYAHGYDKVAIEYAVTTVRGDLEIAGTPVYPAGSAEMATFQPTPSATEIRVVAAVATIAADSTALEGEEYSDLLSPFIRVQMTDTSTSAGTITGWLVFKSSS